MLFKILLKESPKSREGHFEIKLQTQLADQLEEVFTGLTSLLRRKDTLERISTSFNHDYEREGKRVGEIIQLPSKNNSSIDKPN